MPKWATEERKRQLVRLFHRSGGFCVFGEKPCKHPELHHYGFYVEELIRYWIAEDRAQREADWQAERRRIHRGPVRIRQGRFDTVSRDEFLARQPDYYLVAMSVDALTFRPVAQARIASTHVHLFVDIGPTLQGVSRNRRLQKRREG